MDDGLNWVRYLGGPLDRVVHHLRRAGGPPNFIPAQAQGGTGLYVAEHRRDGEGSWLYRWTGVDAGLPVPPLRVVEIVPSGADWPRVGAQFTYLNPGALMHGSFRVRAWGPMDGHPRGVWMELEGADESPAPPDDPGPRRGRPPRVPRP